MKLYDIYQLFVQASPPILILLIVVLSLIEITPIKVNPLRAIGRALAKGITSETNDKIDKMSKSFEGKIEELDSKIDKLDMQDEQRVEQLGDKLHDKMVKMETDYNKRIDEVQNAVNTVDNQLNTHVRESEKRELKDRRQSILDFASAIAGGRNYTRERYEQMLIECDEYEEYCEEKKFKNSVAMASMAIIKRTYEQHLTNNDFLATVEYNEFYTNEG